MWQKVSLQKKNAAFHIKKQKSKKVKIIKDNTEI